jgi:WS/DGAT/MGAT family acyltransferase
MTAEVAMTGERFSGVDRAWLNMERPTNPMVIIALIVFAAPLELDRLRAVVRDRFLVIERFRCVPVADGTGARWESLREVQLDDHVIRAALPEPAGQAELEALVGELAGAPFNPARPLWSFHLVERYRKGSALIARIHHAYADGIALVQVLLGLADRAPRAKAHRRQHRPAQPQPDMALRSHASIGPGLLSALPAPVLETLSEGAALIEKGLHYLLHPRDAAVVAHEVAEFAGELAHIAALSDDPLTPLKRSLSGVHRVAWADPLSLLEVKTIGRLLDCTVNDVLISTLAGALGRLLATQEDVPEDRVIRAVVPVNLRTKTEPPLGNRFGLVFVELPVGIRHPLQRLYGVRTAMQALRGSSQPLVTLGLLWAVGSLPRQVEDLAIDLFSAKASLVASNLRGPAEPLAIGGARVSEVLFWVPQSGSLGVGVSMLSYAGRVQLGVMADRNLIPHPAELVALVAAEFERLVYLVLLGGAVLED